MGGPGSGGFKNSPGDIDVHEAWEVLDHDPSNTQKLPTVRCRYCFKSHARHTSRQRTHLLTCQAYLSAMANQNISNTITRAAAEYSPSSPSNSNTNGQGPPLSHPTGTGSVPTVTRKSLKASGASSASSSHHHHSHPSHGFQHVQRFQEHPLAIKIQALALAEANISESFIYDCTGVDTRTLAMLRRVARERGLDPSKSRALREEYVTNLPISEAGMAPVTPGVTGGKKRPRDSLPQQRERERENEDGGGEVNGDDNGGGGGGGSGVPGGNERRGGPGGSGGIRAPPGYLTAGSLPPGNWNFAEAAGFS